MTRVQSPVQSPFNPGCNVGCNPRCNPVQTPVQYIPPYTPADCTRPMARGASDHQANCALALPADLEAKP